MRSARIAIVGAGLSGLHAAWLLERQGLRDYILLEARDAPGGRVASVGGAAQGEPDAAGSIDRFDVGPTWFWPEYQGELHHLIEDLGLKCFEQYESGDMMVERSPGEAPMRMPGYVTSPKSMRLVGGMDALTNAMHRAIEPTRIITGQVVRRLRRSDSHVELDCEDPSGRTATWQAGHVLLALPPRLVEHTIRFEPALPQALTREWRATPTWMAPHAKYVAIYDTPFWREQGLSGEGRSACGPMGEIHDASMPGGKAALFGFLGLPARVRKDIVDDTLRAHCRAQLVRLFGPQAALVRADFVKDWAQERFTAVADDLEAASHHSPAPATRATSGPWHGYLTGIASEWSTQFPGYLAGAIEAAALAVRQLTASTAAPPAGSGNDRLR